ncbi:MAG TPA: hypothetical protein VKJ47_17915, partial [Candidatus Binatia bacterium]|nr:hypothetical protein [Candidatus Binatia bacterium]
RGFLKNEETKKGFPARLVLGDPLPEERPILPTPEEVLTCCSVDAGDTTSLPDPADGEEEKDSEEF